jgi:hypothetical protein
MVRVNVLRHFNYSSAENASHSPFQVIEYAVLDVPSRTNNLEQGFDYSGPNWVHPQL